MRKRLEWVDVKTRLPDLAHADDKEVRLGSEVLPAYLWSDSVPVLLSNGRKTMDRLVCRSDRTLPPFWYLNESRVLYWFDLPPSPVEFPNDTSIDPASSSSV